MPEQTDYHAKKIVLLTVDGGAVEWVEVGEWAKYIYTILKSIK